MSLRSRPSFSIRIDSLHIQKGERINKSLAIIISRSYTRLPGVGRVTGVRFVKIDHVGQRRLQIVSWRNQHRLVLKTRADMQIN